MALARFLSLCWPTRDFHNGNTFYGESHPRLLGSNADVEEVLRQSGNPRAPPVADEADFRLSSRRRRRRPLAFPPPAAAVFVVAFFGALNIDLTCSQRSPTSEKRSGRRRLAAMMGLSHLVALPTFVVVPNTCQ